MLELQPTLDRILVRPKAAEKETAGGIIMPEGAGSPHAEGEVVAVGPGRWMTSGKQARPGVDPGDTILYARMAGVPVTYGGEKLLLLREEDILAWVCDTESLYGGTRI